MFEQTKPNLIPNKPFATLVLLSFCLHIFFIFQFKLSPDIQIKEEIFEVSLIEPEKPVPIAKRLPKSIKPSPKKLRKGKPNQFVTKANPKTSIQDTESSKSIFSPPQKPVIAIQSKLYKQGSDGTVSNVRISGKKLEIPGLGTENKETSSELTPLPKTVVSKRQTSDLTSKGSPSPEISNLDVNQVSKGDIKDDINPNIKDHVTNTNDPNKQDGIKGNGSDTEIPKGNSIKGDLSQRKVLYKPNHPQLNLDRDITIVMEVTVLPNGEVDQVIPIQKADPELEKLAIETLYQYRYEPLFGSKAVEKGRVNFTIKRKK